MNTHILTPHRTAPHRTAPHRTAPHRTAPHRTAPHRTAPHRTAPHRTAPHRNLATTRFNSSRTAFTLLRTVISHFICGFFVALFNVNLILFNALRGKNSNRTFTNSIGTFLNSIGTFCIQQDIFTNSVKYSAVNTVEKIFNATSPLKKTSQNYHLVAYFFLPNGTKSHPSQVLSFVTSTI
ncbi:hypothetical protein [uncultured Gammaproteobacteria bacterium]|nr:hypothetical protein [uncultured Gammaproteobacteria bacterium]